jgi:hypothetical protein
MAIEVLEVSLGSGYDVFGHYSALALATEPSSAKRGSIITVCLSSVREPYAALKGLMFCIISLLGEIELYTII